jgi:sortase A
MNKLKLGLVIAGLGIGGWLGIKNTNTANLYTNKTNYAVISVTPVPSPGLPVTLIIQKLDVNTRIEPVQKNRAGEMDIPQVVSNAGWYSLGVRPGETGNAVIDGHVNNPQLKPEIFAHLDRLEPGDKVTIIDETGKEWNFQVLRVKNLPEKNFPIEEVFGAGQTANLNLITCGGEWDKILKTYNKRVVVFTRFLQ